MKKIILLTMAVIVAGGILAGCGGGDSGGDGDVKTTGATPKTKADERGDAKTNDTPL